MYPIVLAHGIARFDILPAAAGWNAYFKFIPDHLEERGFRVHETSVDFAGSVVKRASELRAQIERILSQTGEGKVHIIAHSMGGLDARLMIVDEGMAERVASLTTIGTPHLGTPLADEGLELGDALIDDLGKLGLDLQGLRDLSSKACGEFNERAEAAEASNPVYYSTYSSFQDGARVFAPLKLSWKIIMDREGPNDGLVPTRSQDWTEVLRSPSSATKTVAQRRFLFQADHLNQVGWWDPDELAHLSLFRRWWWTWNPWRYERAVRRAYLGIARRVSRL